MHRFYLDVKLNLNCTINNTFSAYITLTLTRFNSFFFLLLHFFTCSVPLLPFLLSECSYLSSCLFCPSSLAAEPTVKEAEVPRRFSLTSSLASSSSSSSFATRRTKGTQLGLSHEVPVLWGEAHNSLLKHNWSFWTTEASLKYRYL